MAKERSSVQGNGSSCNNIGDGSDDGGTAETDMDDTLASAESSDRDGCSTAQNSENAEETAAGGAAQIPPNSEAAEPQSQLPSENQDAPSRVIHFQDSVHVDIPNSPKTISDSSNMEKRACRICQSETGEMVRPCACTGTMGDIHERCLNEWLLRSNNNDRCEICQEKYSKSGNILQPIWKWQKPQIEMTNIVEVSSVICLSLCLWYMITLTIEREFFERIFSAGLPPRSPDVARICKHILVTLLITSTLLGGLMNTVMRIWHYVNKQRAVRFVDSDVNKKTTK